MDARIKEAIIEAALGGTAVGTGLNAHPDFGPRAAEIIADATGLPVIASGGAGGPDHFAPAFTEAGAEAALAAGGQLPGGMWISTAILVLVSVLLVVAESSQKNARRQRAARMLTAREKRCNPRPSSEPPTETACLKSFKKEPK